MALLSCGMSTLVEGLEGSFRDGKLSQKVLSAGLEKLSLENLDLSFIELSVSGTPKLNFPLAHFSTTFQLVGRPRCSLVTWCPVGIKKKRLYFLRSHLILYRFFVTQHIVVYIRKKSKCRVNISCQ